MYDGRLQCNTGIMATTTVMANSLYEAVNAGDVDKVMELLKKGANVNILSSSGRTALGRAAQLGHLAIVSLLLDADKFYTTPEEEEEEEEGEEEETSLFLPTPLFSKASPLSPTSGLSPLQSHKCCSPSIDSETCTCSDEVWGQDLSDTNAGPQSDRECSVRRPKESHNNNTDDTTQADLDSVCGGGGGGGGGVVGGGGVGGGGGGGGGGGTYGTNTGYTNTQYTSSNIGYFVYEYREDEDTGDSSGPVLSSTEDSDSSRAERRHHPHPPHHHRPSSILLHRTVGRGRANIVSSDSEFETEKRRRRRHARHNHRNQRQDKYHGRAKALVSPHHPSSPWLAHLHSEYLSLGLASPWALRRTCDINQHDAYGRSALHYATEQGHTYIVNMLIKAGVRVDTADAEHMTALHLAAQRGLGEVVTLLLEAGARVNNKMNDKSSPLHIAASRGYTDIVETLLDRGAKLDSLDNSDRTPLILAVSRAHSKVVNLLLNRGAKVNIEEIHGYTPLCEAVWQKDARLVQQLLSAGAKVTQSHYLLHYAVLHHHVQIAEMLLSARCIVNLRDDNGDTPLNLAARTCQPALLPLLLRNGANANYPNGLTGTTALHEAVEVTRDDHFQDFLVIFRMLRLYGARLDVETFTTGDTPLYRALLLEKNKAAALLIQSGCNVNHPTPPSTPDYLRMAATRSHTPLAMLLILAGFHIGKAKWLAGTHSPGTLMARLAAVRSSPLCLADLCRIRIRQLLGDKLESRLDSSRLPSRLKRFLLLQDVAEVEL